MRILIAHKLKAALLLTLLLGLVALSARAWKPDTRTPRRGRKPTPGRPFDVLNRQRRGAKPLHAPPCAP